MADLEAEAAIVTAIKNLVASGKRAYSISVPEAAAAELVRQGEGSITQEDAWPRVTTAIGDMASAGTLEAHNEPWKDWRLL